MAFHRTGHARTQMSRPGGAVVEDDPVATFGPYRLKATLRPSRERNSPSCSSTDTIVHRTHSPGGLRLNCGPRIGLAQASSPSPRQASRWSCARRRHSEDRAEHPPPNSLRVPPICDADAPPNAGYTTWRSRPQVNETAIRGDCRCESRSGGSRPAGVRGVVPPSSRLRGH